MQLKKLQFPLCTLALILDAAFNPQTITRLRPLSKLIVLAEPRTPLPEGTWTHEPAGVLWLAARLIFLSLLLLGHSRTNLPIHFRAGSAM